jgi:hypothetical protein
MSVKTATVAQQTPNVKMFLVIGNDDGDDVFETLPTTSLSPAARRRRIVTFGAVARFSIVHFLLALIITWLVDRNFHITCFPRVENVKTQSATPEKKGDEA